MHVTDTLAVGGKERMLVEIANQSAQRGDTVCVCVTRENLDLASHLDPSISVQALNRQQTFDRDGFRCFKNFLLAEKPQILQAHGRSVFSFLAYLKTLRQFSIPIILHDHYGGIEIDPTVSTWFRLWGRHLVDSYVGVYGKLGQWAKEAGVTPDKIGIIENGIKIRAFQDAEGWDLRSRFNLPKGSIIGVLVGGFRTEKGLDLLVEALALVQKTFKTHILVVGEAKDQAYVASCQEQIRAYSLERHFKFVGQQTATPEILRGADFALLPSRSESGPLVLIEYLAAGLPVAAFQVGAISQTAAEQGLPGLVPPENVTAFAKEMNTILSLSTESLRVRGRIGQGIAQAHFDITDKMPQWYALYEQLVQGKKQ